MEDLEEGSPLGGRFGGERDGGGVYVLCIETKLSSKRPHLEVDRAGLENGVARGGSCGSVEFALCGGLRGGMGADCNLVALERSFVKADVGCVLLRGGVVGGCITGVLSLKFLEVVLAVVTLLLPAASSGVVTALEAVPVGEDMPTRVVEKAEPALNTGLLSPASSLSEFCRVSVNLCSEGSGVRYGSGVPRGVSRVESCGVPP